MLSCWKEIGVSFFLLIYSKAGALSSNIPPSILQPRLPQRTPQPCYITGKSLLSFFLEVMSFFSPLFCLSASRCCFGETTSLQLLQHSSFLFFFMLHISAPKGGGGFLLWWLKFRPLFSLYTLCCSPVSRHFENELRVKRRKKENCLILSNFVMYLDAYWSRALFGQIFSFIIKKSVLLQC